MKFSRRGFFSLIAGAFAALSLSHDSIRTKIKQGWVLREDDA